ncbi:MAG: NDP-sugar synthase [Oscillospiraceae bacterium]|jgi:bifunctional UDP-N-acetylglucosamine pyrophosphorylase/glucosamine-1-phosphate N-acetyltransferase|nr:NDP-sugar synthase [Oscillospiraceae bacterium]
MQKKVQSAVILDAGKGSRLWPYAQIRSKGMIPIAGKPLLRHLSDGLRAIGITEIVIVAGSFVQEIRREFRADAGVAVLEDKNPRGSAFSLLKAKELLLSSQGFLLLYSDVAMAPAELLALKEAYEACGQAAALLAPLKNVWAPQRSREHIVCGIESGYVADILGHPREKGSYFFAGFAFAPSIFGAAEANGGRFVQTEVGMMPPLEGFLEMTLADMIADGEKILAVEAKRHVVDIDKPWQILEANALFSTLLCGALTETVLGEGASVHPSAMAEGFVSLGKGSRIGRNVIIEGNVMIGENTVVENGAILKGGVIIGSNCEICNGCLLEENAAVGNRCYVGHGAELNGILFDNAFLYHYMEIYGIVGENVDIGAATVCGSLRFDDSVTLQRVKGHGEPEQPYSDAVFFGDYCRTGVNAIIMPGVKIGVYSVVGAGVNLLRDLEDHTLIYAEQTQVKKAWGPEKYGW